MSSVEPLSGTSRASRTEATSADAPLETQSAPVEAEAFEAFYQRWFGPMVRLAHAMVDTTELAEEVAQDAFAAVFTRYHRLDNPEAYLRSCVVNGCRSIQRRRALVRRKPMPPPELVASDEHDHLMDAVARLSARQRAVVVLRYHEGLSEADIARTLGIAPGSVKSNLSRARARLRAELQEELER